MTIFENQGHNLWNIFLYFFSVRSYKNLEFGCNIVFFIDIIKRVKCMRFHCKVRKFVWRTNKRTYYTREGLCQLHPPLNQPTWMRIFSKQIDFFAWNTSYILFTMRDYVSFAPLKELQFKFLICVRPWLNSLVRSCPVAVYRRHAMEGTLLKLYLGPPTPPPPLCTRDKCSKTNTSYVRYSIWFTHSVGSAFPYYQISNNLFMWKCFVNFAAQLIMTR